MPLVATCVFTGLAGSAVAQSADELRRSAGNGDVLTHGMGNGLQRFGTQAQINKVRVRRLVPRWAYALGDDRGQESQPLVRDEGPATPPIAAALRPGSPAATTRTSA